MSEIKKIATRESYGNALVEVGKEHEDLIVLDADLAGATKTGIFKKAFPERHWDVGIAEANMTGIAAGLATCGKVPFISSFAMFAAGRNFEQVRNSIGYPHLNVKIGAPPLQPLWYRFQLASIIGRMMENKALGKPVSSGSFMSRL